MRPLELTLSGFRSHERETTFSFEERRFVAIVGPTGSGKSSILDGICYALYGKTPRVKTGQKRLICTRCDSARVRLRFLVDEHPYEIVRALPRNGSGEHVLTDAASGDVTSGEGPVTQRVTELLGLDFDAFCSSVLLAQNKFSEFLEAATTRRTQILKGVFRLEQVDELRAAAKTKVGELNLGLAEIEGERRGIPADVDELLESERARLKRASEREKDLARAVPEEKELEDLLATARSGAAEAESGLQAVREALSRIPTRDALAELVEIESVVLEKLEHEEKRAEELADKVEAAAAAVAAVEAEDGTEGTLLTARARAEEGAALALEIDEMERDRAERAAELDELLKKATAAEAAFADATAKLLQVRDEKKTIEDAHRAHVLRGTLAKGEPCPVCEQVVSSVPKRRAPAALSVIDKKEKAADKAVAAARDKEAAAQQAVSAGRAHVESCVRSLEKARAKVKTIGAELVKIVGKVENPKAEIDRRLARRAVAAEAMRMATSDRDAARASLEESRRVEREFDNRKRRVAATLIEVAVRAGLEAPDVEARAERLAADSERMRSVLAAAREDAEAALEKANLHATEITTSLKELRGRLEVPSEESIAEARAVVQADVAVAQKTIADLEGKIARAKELTVQEETLTVRKNLFVQLSDDLTDKHFLNYLLEDRRRLLSDLGSERLRAMTGRYRFDDRANFDVVDELDGDKLREVQTLSGGETFLASLALALGLAEAVARHGGRLKCFFMDEGFGSLDPESLDLALDGIENIVRPDRLIGLVSHVPGVAMRVEDKIELEKSPDGMTIVNSGSSNLPE